MRKNHDQNRAIGADDPDHFARHGRGHPRKRQANRGHLPKHLPRVHVTVTPDETKCPCCQGAMHVIGEETSERLDVIRPSSG